MQQRAAMFERALAERPWLLGYRSAMASRFSASDQEIAVEGHIPAALSGRFYRNGPGGHDVAGHRYAHWFDGDGLLHAFDLRNGTIRHQGRLMATPKRRAESRAGRPLYDGFGTRVPDPAAIRGPDELNTANISVLSHGGRLMALWEGGSASEVDPETLEHRSFVEFSPETQGLPFSAHTRTEPDGTLWSIGYAGYAEKIVIYRIGFDGNLANVRLLDARPTPMLHDFLVTEHHLILIMPPWLYDHSAGDTFLERHVWRPEQGGSALIIDKNSLQVTGKVDLPAFWSFHYANAWEDSSGVVHFDFARYPDPGQTSHGFLNVMEGQAPSGSEPRYHRATIDVRAGRYREEEAIPDIAAEFPRVSPERAGLRHDRTMLCLSGARSVSEHPGFDATAMFYPDSGKIDRYVHGAQEMAEEAVLARDADGSTWVLQTVLDFGDQLTKLKIFLADDLAAGPVAVASLPYALPLGLHGLFVT